MQDILFSRKMSVASRHLCCAKRRTFFARRTTVCLISASVALLLVAPFLGAASHKHGLITFPTSADDVEPSDGKRIDWSLLNLGGDLSLSARMAARRNRERSPSPAGGGGARETSNPTTPTAVRTRPPIVFPTADEEKPATVTEAGRGSEGHPGERLDLTDDGGGGEDVQTDGELDTSGDPLLNVLRLCDFDNGQVFFDGGCEKLARAGTAACGGDPGRWLVLNRTSLTPECVAVPCFGNGSATDDEGEPVTEFMWSDDGECHRMVMINDERGERLGTSDVCAENEVVVFDHHGMGTCECAPGTGYWMGDKRCHSAYMRGPCEPGHMFAPMRGFMECLRNPCNESMTLMWSNGLCYPMMEQGPCPDGKVVSVDPKTMLPACLHQSVDDFMNLRNLLRLAERGSRARLDVVADVGCGAAGSKMQAESVLCALSRSFAAEASLSGGVSEFLDTVDRISSGGVLGNGNRTSKGSGCDKGFYRNTKTGKCAPWRGRRG